MIQALALILLCQLVGETVTRAAGLPAPGPVLGMGLLLLLLALSERLAVLVVPLGEGILRHLALLFVPAGVGVVGHLDRLGSQALWLLLAIVLSTVLALLAGALAFLAVSRLTGSHADGDKDA